jgi:hypothetical protein
VQALGIVLTTQEAEFRGSRFKASQSKKRDPISKYPTEKKGLGE